MKAISLFLTVVSLALSGCEDAANLHDPITFQEALAEALGEEELERKQEGEEEILFRKDTQAPFTGWFVARWKAEQLMEQAEPMAHQELTQELDQDEKPLRILARYKDGRRDGPYTEYFEDFRTRLQGHYKAGKKDGPWREWDEDNNEAQVNYVDGEKARP